MAKDDYLNVFFYKNPSGNEPVRDWLQILSREEKKIIGEDIKTVQFGWPLRMPLIRKLDVGLWEIRSYLDHKIARVLFTVSGKTMILLHGFIKKSQKTPNADMAIAKKRLMDVKGQEI